MSYFTDNENFRSVCYNDCCRRPNCCCKCCEGKRGPKGDKGDAFTYEDFSPEQLASLKGPKGDQGRNGTDGRSGTNGQNGKSAYEVAVDNGFVGTEEEWLASLIGPVGPDGNSGFLVFNTGYDTVELIDDESQGIRQRAVVGPFLASTFTTAGEEIDLSAPGDVNKSIVIPRDGRIMYIAFYARGNNLIASNNFTSLLATLYVNRNGSGDNIFRPFADVNFRGSPLFSPETLDTSIGVPIPFEEFAVSRGDRVTIVLTLRNTQAAASVNVGFNATLGLTN